MLIRDTPKNIDTYIKVDDKTTKILHANGYSPLYMDNKYIYYKKTDDIIKFMKKEGLECQK